MIKERQSTTIIEFTMILSSDVTLSEGVVFSVSVGRTL